MRLVRTGLAVVATGFVIAWLLLGCGTTAREKTISTTLTAIKAADAAFRAWDAQHQHIIVIEAKDEPSGRAALDAYRTKQLEIERLFTATYAATATAATVENDQTLQGLIAAALLLSKQLHALGVL